VKAQELEHVGLEDWLKSQKGPVTRDQVNQFIESQQPQIREVTKNDYEKVENKYPHIVADSALSPINPTKHSQWQLPGGSNYGETLLTLPPKASDIPGWKIVPHPSGEGFALQNPSGEYKLAGPDYRYPGRPLQWKTRGRAEQGGMAVYNRDQENYTSSHWEEPNVLLHTRHNDRVIPGPNGELLNSLHLEEIQSDWHQAGRKRGYATPGNETFSVEKTGDTWRVLNNRTGMVPYSNIRSEVEARERAAAYNQGSGKVPDAPFKTTWSDLALKRMLHRAATDRNPDGSYKYDAMSWTPGQEQADRYDLSKQVDSVFAHKNSDGTIDLFAEMSRNGRKERVPVQENAHPDKIADYVGKDLADKIAKQKDRQQEYKGADLKVGGEGMRAFYDKMLPDKANALVKKFGTKVEKAQVPTSTRPTSPNSMADQLNDLIEEAGGEPTHAKKAATAPVHMIRITPQLRAAAERGFPTFAYGGAIRATKAIKSA
jgi:hypothetical protein